MSFQRRVEDFVCEHCGTFVHGDGYTNHCPECLWSKHVDISPGDRAESCGGMMEPVRIEGSTPLYRIVHKCTVCGIERRIDISRKDNMETLLAISARSGNIEAMQDLGSQEDSAPKDDEKALDLYGKNPLAEEEAIQEDDSAAD